MSELVDRISRELSALRIAHSLKVQPVGEPLADRRSVVELIAFSSLRELAAALERVGADASWSASGGFHFHPEQRP